MERNVFVVCCQSMQGPVIRTALMLSLWTVFPGGMELAVAGIGGDCNGNDVPDSLDVPQFPFYSSERLALRRQPTSIVAADFDGDQVIDLAVAVLSGDVEVHLAAFSDTPRGWVDSLNVGAFVSMVAEDFNADGAMDLAAVETRSNNVTVMLGNGDGTFQPPTNYPVQEEPNQVIAVDMNRDSVVDLVVGNSDSASISVLDGMGEGTFSAAESFSISSHPMDMAVADFNGDGLMDVAVASSNNVTVLFGDRDTVFRAPVDIEVPRIYGLTATDVNKDGASDLVVVTIPGDVELFVGSTESTFDQRPLLNVGGNPDKVVPIDIDGDDRVDFAISDRVTQQFILIQGAEDETFREYVRLPVGRFALGVVVKDVDGDGWADFIVAARDSEDVTLYRGKDRGSFHDARSFPGGYEPNSLTVADIDLDGDLDALMTDSEDGLTLVKQESSGDFPEATIVRTAISNVRWAALGRFDSDEWPDIAVVYPNEARVDILLSLAGEGFSDPSTVEVDEPHFAIVAENFDGNDVDDLAILNHSGITTLLASGGGDFMSTQQIPLGDRQVALAAADLNDDGFVDLLTAESEDQNALFLFALLGRGNGEFDSALISPMRFSVQSLTVGDVNDDGRLDVIATSFEENAVTVALGEGDGRFALGQSLTTADRPRLSAIADVDQDGWVDIATVNQTARSVSLFTGAGDGTFRSLGELSTQGRPVGLFVSDINDNGGPELLTVSASGRLQLFVNRSSEPSSRDCNGNHTPDECDVTTGNSLDADRNGIPDECEVVATIRNDCNVNGFDDQAEILAGESEDCDTNGVPDECNFSDRRFAFRQRDFPVGDDPLKLAAGDFNGDGFDDVVTLNDDSHDLTVLLSDGVDRLRFSQTVPTAQKPSGIAMGDFNLDGAIDLAVTHPSTAVSGHFGSGNGRFGSRRSLASDRVISLNIAAADLNDDGRVDLIVGENVLLGVGDGSFREGIRYRSSQTTAFVAADFDGDDLLDLVSTERDADEIRLWPGLGDGTFGVPRIFGPISTPRHLFATDFNRDGILDVAVSRGSSGSRTAILLGHSDGGFLPPRGFADGAGSARPAVGADGDGDGHTDIFVVSLESNLVEAMLGDGSGRFAPPVPFGVGAEPTWIVQLDVNGDGYPEIATSNRSDTVSLLINESAPFVKADCNDNGAPDACDIGAGDSTDVNTNEIPDDCEGGLRVPGDCDQNAGLDVSDPICLFLHLFGGNPRPLPCGDGSVDAAGNIALLDHDSNSELDLADGVGLLLFLFTDAGESHPLSLPGAPLSCVPVPECDDNAACQ